jgi:integrase
MRSFKKGECRWRIILTLGRGPDGKWKQRWISFTGTRQGAEAKMRELVGEVDRGEFVEPSKMTLGEWLEEWLEKSVKVKHSVRTYATYKAALNKHLLKSSLASVQLQRVTPLHIERYHHEKTELAVATRNLHHAILCSALKLALRDGLVRRNVATLATERPNGGSNERAFNAWTAEEARTVLAEAKRSGTAQMAAFVALALDSGGRKSELLGLRWTDFDLTTGALRIERQLVKGGAKPEFGPTKTRTVRTLDLSEQTLVLLREHKRKQAELKLANRPHYADHGLVFAQEWEHQGNSTWQLGAPLSVGVIGRVLDRLVTTTKVRRITVHGLRHTSATLLLAAGVQPHVVQQRLGHSNISTTMDIYGHVIPAQQQDAARRLATSLHG